ncbi:LysM peptidoglycan-binding domain-containing protein [Acinetobacter rathckeae]|uniref:LysM peptidoglycan-binding domain-containing protein n=1 Tax=Acinetobacter rathckeae TaxID=2605272 RepID=UPI0018A28AB7|nr:LysM peptidoglycan-binding domain-containing protein [Acinetobacter rathckeae]MBF7688640.1 LysM peptidoglycan-binding domain-containing protein [Acinetobacter rathckeae]MBF7695886.1 LysM peptidoglycan-binding domain-containing protein [Acinetobacter rathckeae]
MFKSTTVLWHSALSNKFKMSLLGSTVLGLLLTTGCASTSTTSTVHKTHTATNSQANNANSGLLDANSLDSLEDLLSATDMRAVEGDRLLILKHGDVWKRMTVGFKMDETKWDPRIEAQRNWFISRQPYLDRLSARASRYLYHTVKEAERRGMPTELALLPVIESSYDPSATSSASAAGLWQFIPSTGKIYGLQQTGSYDARRDVVESTRAAYEFLGSLYNQFGSWELALAAYNAGPGRVQQAINRNAAAGLPTDYWSLKLPPETMNYVPRFLAVAQIVKDQKAYGITLPPIANRPHFREVQVQPGVSLVQIAELTGVSRSELSTLNPGYRGDFIDAASPGRVLIPSDVSLSVDQRVSALKGNGSASLWVNTSPAPVVIKPTPNAITPVVITPQKRVTPKDANDLAAFANNADVPSAPRIPIAVTTASDLKKPISVEPPISVKERDRIVAEIKADDAKETVSSVVQPVANNAEQQQVISELKAIAPAGTEVVDPYDGKIKLTAIQTSQSIADSQGKEVTKSFASDDSKDKRNIENNQPKGTRSTYTVAAGDTLATIAAKNGVSWRDIAKWNQIDPNASLYVGNILYLYDAKPQPQTTNVTKPEVYTVKANDSLTALASQYGISIKDLADWNDLQPNSNLMVGQKLYLREPKESSVSTKSTKNKPKTVVYSVRKGESLRIIAERYDLSVQALADLTPSLTASSGLMVGQKINVPQGDSDTDQNDRSRDISRLKTELYKVQRKETFADIADKFDLSVADLAKINQVKANHMVKVGQVIKVPKVEQPQEYIVQRGDTLASIAAHFKFQPNYLARMNGLSSKSTVRVGQKLTLVEKEEPTEVSKPAAKSEASAKKVTSTRATESYTVKAGDSFNSIAKRYDLTIKELAEMNAISVKSMLKPGQEIDVPKKTISYKVKSGDNWIKLAAKYDLEPKDLADMNDTSTSKALRIGAVIQVPNK